MEHIKQVFKMWPLVSELKYHCAPVCWLLGSYLQACHIVCVNVHKYELQRKFHYSKQIYWQRETLSEVHRLLYHSLCLHPYGLHCSAHSCSKCNYSDP